MGSGEDYDETNSYTSYLDSDDSEPDQDDDFLSDMQYDPNMDTAITKSIEVNQKRGGKKRQSMKDVSRAQRQKRKYDQKLLEEQAKTINERLERELAERQVKISRMKNTRKMYILKLRLFLTFFFGKAQEFDRGSSWSQHFDAESMIIRTPKQHLFYTSPLPPSNVVYEGNSDTNRISLQGTAQITSYKIGYNLLNISIARLGKNVTDQLIFGVHLRPNDIVIGQNVATCHFTVTSKNAVLCGAAAEITFSGMLYATFSPTSEQLTHVDLFYNSVEVSNQLIKYFGLNQYRPLYLENYTIFRPLNADSSALDIELITTFPPDDMVESIGSCRIMSGNSLAITSLGSAILGENIECCIENLKSHLNPTQITSLLKWTPATFYVGRDKTLFTGQPHLGHILVQVLPFCDPVSLESMTSTNRDLDSRLHEGHASMVDDGSHESTHTHTAMKPDRLMWIFYKCRDVDSANLVQVLIDDFLSRIVATYRDDGSAAGTTDSRGRDARQKSLQDLVDSAQKIEAMTAEGVNLKTKIKKFLRWVMHVEKACSVSEGAAAGPDIVSTIPIGGAPPANARNVPAGSASTVKESVPMTETGSFTGQSVASGYSGGSSHTANSKSSAKSGNSSGSNHSKNSGNSKNSSNSNNSSNSSNSSSSTSSSSISKALPTMTLLSVKQESFNESEWNAEGSKSNDLQGFTVANDAHRQQNEIAMAEEKKNNMSMMKKASGSIEPTNNSNMDTEPSLPDSLLGDSSMPPPPVA